jgi:hypothetical protein
MEKSRDIKKTNIGKVHCLFIMNGEGENYKEDQYRIVGAMKDEKLKVRGLHTSDTLGYCLNTEVILSLFSL